MRTQYGAVATGNDEQLISNLVRAQQDLKIQRKQLDKQVAGREGEARPHRGGAAEGRAGQLAGDRAAVASEGSDRDADRAGEGAAGRGRARPRSQQLAQPGQRRVDAFRPPTSAATQIPNLPAPSPRAAAAIAYAEAQLGKPYQYAAIGPEHLRLLRPHDDGVGRGRRLDAPLLGRPVRRCSRTCRFDQLEPGDLLFWGPGGSEHVAMYIGGGLQIAATHTGDYVRIQPMGSNPVGAARP